MQCITRLLILFQYLPFPNIARHSNNAKIFIIIYLYVLGTSLPRSYVHYDTQYYNVLYAILKIFKFFKFDAFYNGIHNI